MRTLSTLLATAVLAVGSTMAHAATTNFNFTGSGSSNFGPVVYRTSADGNINATITSFGGSGVSGYSLDGLGVAGNGYRGIQGGETLRIDFDQYVDIETLWLRQWEGPDRAQVTINFRDGSTQVIQVNTDSNAFDTNEYVALNVAGVDFVDVTGVWNGSILGIPQTIFFVAGFQGVSVAEIPLPAAAWLFGSALVVLGGVARRRGQSEPASA